MNVVNRITCPTCKTPLKSVRGIRLGKKIKCLKCGIAFTVRPEDAAEAEQSAGVNGGRLFIVLVGALVFLSGGGALAFFCFTENLQHQQAVGPPEAKKDKAAEEEPPPAPPTVKLPTKAAPGALSLAEQLAVDRAIAKGVWFLKDRAAAAGGWGDSVPGLGGVTVAMAALPALTLLECGVPANDPVVQKAASLVRQDSVRPDLPRGVYQRSLAILFLDRLRDKKDDGLIQYLALCLMAAQHPTDGAWSYDTPTLDRKQVPQLLKLLKDRKQTLDSWRNSALTGVEFQYGGWDNSNTQFAVLALWVAGRHGVPIDRSAKLFEKHFRTTQLADVPERRGQNVSLDGSWYYDYIDGGRNSSGWPSMTCSGLLALAIVHGAEETPKKGQAKSKQDPAIARGLAMLGREIDRPEEPRPIDFYFLWSLERVGVLYKLPTIAGKDWYAWGRKHLLPNQQKDGSWPQGNFVGEMDILNTCFALLFLKQANLAEDLTNKLEALGISVSAVPPTIQAPPKKE